MRTKYNMNDYKQTIIDNNSNITFKDLDNELKNKFNIEQKSLLYVTLISSLAPLSWHILAKAHSYVHTHMNHILWYSPFLLLIFVFIGLTISRLKISFKNISICNKK